VIISTVWISTVTTSWLAGDAHVAGVFEVSGKRDDPVEFVPDLTRWLSPRRVAHRQELNQARGGQRVANQVQELVPAWRSSFPATTGCEPPACDRPPIPGWGSKFLDLAECGDS
jgi:hypothetical protein